MTEILMIPIHVLEGLSVRYGLARALYQVLASIYELGRAFFYFGEDYFEAAVKPGDRVLELGSGTGYLTRRLARRADMVIGLERERQMVRKAWLKRGKARYVIGDMTRLPFKPGSFDRCVSLGALHCVDPAEFFPETDRVLRSGGEALVLSEMKIIPRFVPRAGGKAIRDGIRKAGMRLREEVEIRYFYRLFRAVKNHKE